MKYNNKYEYTHFSSKTSKDGSRVYKVGDNWLPSVTTILSATKPKKDLEGLKKWRKSVGDEEADRIVQKSVNIGNQLHDNLENHLREGAAPQGSVLVKLMTKMVIKEGLSNLNEWWGAECPLYYDGLYAGTTDLVGVYNGYPAIIDFKNARKIKKLDWITDYCLQLAAYSECHNEMFGTDIKTGVILMVDRQCNFKEFFIQGQEFQKYREIWVSRLEEYYNNHTCYK